MMKVRYKREKTTSMESCKSFFKWMWFLLSSSPIRHGGESDRRSIFVQMSIQRVPLNLFLTLIVVD